MDSANPAQPAPAPHARRSRARRLARFALALLLLLVGAELFARFYLGLGDPPLFITDPQIEYLNKPSMHYRRFGNSISFNDYSMRSGPITPKKSDPSELRVMVVGDSIVNGGSQTDDSRVATALLQSRLAEALKRPVYVGNISAGSWGPPNELAYLKKFGLFDADVLVLVFNSADYDDVPTFVPTIGVNPDQPDHAPILALQEGFTRYLLPRLRGGAAPNDPHAAPTMQQSAPASPESVKQCMDAIREIVAMARSANVKQILIVQHPEARELGVPEWPGHATIAATARELGIEPIQLAPAFAGAAQNPYRDGLHPNDLGQKLIADTLFEPLRMALSK